MVSPYHFKKYVFMMLWGRRDSPRYLIQCHVIGKICFLYLMYKKVVVSSSTKAFTEKVDATIKKVFKEEKKILVYNSATDKNTIHQHATNPNEVWNQYDVLIYSPSITSGISFEVLHFDEIVCFLVNSFHTPTVDLSLQQMFRVRQLTQGNMHIFVNDTMRVKEEEYPIGDDDIARFLDKNIESMSKYFPDDTVAFESTTILTKYGIGYDKHRLSYAILKGIIANKNKSIRHFTDILTKTLEQDYNIKSNVSRFGESKDHLSKCLNDEMRTVSTKNTAPRIKDEDDLTRLKISDSQYEELRDKDIAMETLTPHERMQMHVYHMAVEVWGVSLSKVDMTFFNNFIGYYHEKDRIEQIYEKLYCARRICDLLNYDEKHNEQCMYQTLKNMSAGSKEDGNIKLYRSRVKTYYVRLLEGIRVLRAITVGDEAASTEGKFHTDVLQKVRSDYQLALKSVDIKKNLKIYLQSMTREHFETVQKYFWLSKRTYTFDKLENNYMAYVKSVLTIAFGMEVSTSRKGTKDKAKNSFGTYQEKAWDVNWFHDFTAKYSPCVLKVFPESCQDDCDDLEYKTIT